MKCALRFGKGLASRALPTAWHVTKMPLAVVLMKRIFRYLPNESNNTKTIGLGLGFACQNLSLALGHFICGGMAHG